MKLQDEIDQALINFYTLMLKKSATLWTDMETMIAYKLVNDPEFKTKLVKNGPDTNRQ